ncbi:hypothetical protein ACOMHN_027047 [Nucella lapillus]
MVCYRGKRNPDTDSLQNRSCHTAVHHLAEDTDPSHHTDDPSAHTLWKTDIGRIQDTPLCHSPVRPLHKYSQKIRYNDCKQADNTVIQTDNENDSGDMIHPLPSIAE